MSVQLEFCDGRTLATIGEPIAHDAMRTPVEGETVIFDATFEGFPVGRFTVTWVEFVFTDRQRIARVGIV